MIKYIIGSAMLALVALATPAQAEDSAKQFLVKIDGPNRQEVLMWSSVLSAYGNGISWANSQIETTGGKPLYCQPDNLILTDSQLIDMVRRHLKEFPDEAGFPAGMVVLLTLQNTFPCKVTVQ